MEALYGVQQRGRRMPGWVLITLVCGALAEESTGQGQVCLETHEVSFKVRYKHGHSSKMKILPLFLDYRFRSEKREECLLFFFKMMCFQIYS